MKEKMLLLAASLLGFATACNDKEERITDMYGTPYMNFKVKGKVIDKAGQPIPGIEVRGESEQPVISEKDGSYDLSGRGFPRKIEIVFTDTDGPANGGEFAEKRLEVEFTDADRTAQGDKNWYSGEYSRSGVDAALEEKE